MKKYQQIEEYIINNIKSGKYGEAGKIESVEELCMMFNVSHITVQKAFTELKAKDIIYRKKGMGTFVRREATDKGNKRIALILPLSDERPDSSILAISRAAKTRADQLGYDLSIELCNYDDTCIESAPKVVRQTIEDVIGKGADAIALYASYDLNGSDLYYSFNIPIVMIDGYDEDSPCSYVTANNRDGETIAVDYLINKGHSKIAMLLESGWKITEKERVRGYMNAMKRAGFAKNIHTYEKNKEDLCCIADKIEAGELTAVAAVNDYSALKLMDYLFSRKIRVPADCSIIGFDDNEAARFCSIGLTTIKQYFDDIGICAVNILDEYLSGQSYICRKIYSPIKLVERESVLALK